MGLDAVMASVPTDIKVVPTPARNGKRARGDDKENKPVPMELITKSIAMLDARLRTVESYTEEVFLMPYDIALAQELTRSMNQWNLRKPPKGPHPDGAARLTAAAGFLNYLSKQTCSNEHFVQEDASLKAFCGNIGTLTDLDSNFTMCMAKVTKKGDQLLLKYTWSKTSALNDSARWQISMLTAMGCTRQCGPAPKGPIIRQLE